MCQDHRSIELLTFFDHSGNAGSVNDTTAVPAPEPSPIRQDTVVKPWLAKLGLRADQFNDVELATLKALIEIDTGWRGQLRWANVDVLINKAIQLLMLPRPYSRSPEEPPNALQRFVFPRNRSILLNHPSSIKRMILVNIFRHAGEFYLEKVLQAFIAFMLLYNVSSEQEWGISFLWNRVWNNDTAACESLVGSLNQWPKSALSTLLSSPLLYAAYRTLLAWIRFSAPKPGAELAVPLAGRYRCFARSLPWSLVHAPTQAQEAKIKQRLTMPGLFGRYLRWLLPMPPCIDSGTQLSRLVPMAVTWNGRVTYAGQSQGLLSTGVPSAADRLTFLMAQIALTETGLTQLQAIHGLKHIAHGVSLDDLVKLSPHVARPEIILEQVRVKTIALASLLQVLKLDGQRHNWLQRRMAIGYAQYQLWTLGTYRQLGWRNLPITVVKAIKLYFLIHLYSILINTIIKAIQCPDRPGFSFGTGYAPWASDYSEACFNELVKQFGFWPGQPASTLVDQIPNYHIRSPYALDLSNRPGRLTGFQVAEIMQGFAKHGIWVNSLNLANNTINTLEEIEMMMPTLSSLTALNFLNRFFNKICG